MDGGGEQLTREILGMAGEENSPVEKGSERGGLAICASSLIFCLEGPREQSDY